MLTRRGLHWLSSDPPATGDVWILPVSSQRQFDEPQQLVDWPFELPKNLSLVAISYDRAGQMIGENCEGRGVIESSAGGIASAFERR